MRVILVDDAPLVREGIARLLEAGGFDVVAQRGDAHDLIPLARDLEPIQLLSGSGSGVGYRSRSGSPDLHSALRRVAAGGIAIDPDVVAALLAVRRTPDHLGPLTARERDVLALVAEGRSNDAIVDDLLVTVRTVETHMTNILAKLGLSSEPGTHRRVLAVLAYLRVAAQPG